MIVLILAATLSSLLLAVGFYRRHRIQPAVHHFSMAHHLWQPDRRKL